MTLEELRIANTLRNKEWDPDGQIDVGFRSIEMMGEVGEMFNVVKKLERERMGLRGSRDTKEHLAEEMADVLICLDLIAMQLGINLTEAVRLKFNASSEKHNLSVFLL